MPRVTHVASSRSTQLCGRCGKEIKKGAPYKWAKRFKGPKMIRCDTCEFRPTDLSTSKMAIIEECLSEINLGACETVEEMRSVCEEVATTIKEVAEEYRESSTNIEDGFGHATEQSEELSQKADELENWADEIEAAPDNVEQFDEETTMAEIKERAKVDDDQDDMLEEERESWLQSTRDEIDSILNNCPV